MSVNNRPQHSTVILSTMYTVSFTTKAYESYNVDTNQIAIKNDHHNPQLLLIPPKLAICFLNFIMTTLCSSVIIIIVHENTHYNSNPFILSQITIVYIIHMQHFIKLLLYSSPNLFPTYNTNIVQYSMVYCNTIYPYPLIFIWYTILYSLKYTYKSNLYLFPSTCNDDVLFLNYNHLHLQK